MYKATSERIFVDGEPVAAEKTFTTDREFGSVDTTFTLNTAGLGGKTLVLKIRRYHMKVAVTYENGVIFQHFGRTPQFKVYEITDGKIISSEVIDTNGTGHGALAGFLQNIGVEVLICGGIGGGAQVAMSDVGIRLFAGASGDADEVVNAFIEGILPEIGEATCDHHDHHDHHEGHDCSHGGKCHE